ncbi:P-loop NTPase fold protein [Microbacterium sp.]|uniref:KAP family P-loop NTPase fold protein n=1 Tax=Microbacterium sp. TaxID=51671 RepID=UPI003569232F
MSESREEVAEVRSVPPSLRLLPDDPAKIDLLSFDAIAQTIADALLDEHLDPVALGLSGNWGSGKTTVLNLVEEEIRSRAGEDTRIVVVQTAPWRYDPAVGAKETLIGEVLSAVQTELSQVEAPSKKAKDLLSSLVARVDWAKALKMAASAAVTLQLPDPAQLIDLVKAKSDSPDAARGLEEFRTEFRDLLHSKDLAHVKAVVVLVDDLDRCLPTTVVDSLEAMRLFLDVPKMSFVIAADEDRVADAIRTRFNTTEVSPEESEDAEDPARLYLHKIVQTAFPLPALSNFDTLAFLMLLLLQTRTRDVEQLKDLIRQCADIRRSGGDADDLKDIDGIKFREELAVASRLTPMLHEKMHGNPRRIKRFLNDLAVRQVVAQRRGIDLDAAVVAKLMVLEVVLPAEFKRLLGWFAAGELRDRLERLEAAANVGHSQRAQGSPNDSSEEGEFSDALIRWAKLMPTVGELDLSPYLTLAASFAGVVLVDTKLPERLRDLAANLLSDGRIEQSSVTDADLDSLGEGDLINLIEHIGRTLRDQPHRQKPAVNALLRIARRTPSVTQHATGALRMLSGRDVRIGTPMQFRSDDDKAVRGVLAVWRDGASEMPLRAIENAIKQGEH